MFRSFDFTAKVKIFFSSSNATFYLTSKKTTPVFFSIIVTAIPNFLMAQEDLFCDGVKFQTIKKNGIEKISPKDFPSFVLEKDSNCKIEERCRYSITVGNSRSSLSEGNEIFIENLCDSLSQVSGTGGNESYGIGTGYQSVFELKSWNKKTLKTSAGDVIFTETRYYPPPDKESWSFWIDGSGNSGRTLLQDIITRHVTKNF